VRYEVKGQSEGGGPYSGSIAEISEDGKRDTENEDPRGEENAEVNSERNICEKYKSFSTSGFQTNRETTMAKRLP